MYEKSDGQWCCHVEEDGTECGAEPTHGATRLDDHLPDYPTYTEMCADHIGSYADPADEYLVLELSAAFG